MEVQNLHELLVKNEKMMKDILISLEALNESAKRLESKWSPYLATSTLTVPESLESISAKMDQDITREPYVTTQLLSLEVEDPQVLKDEEVSLLVGDQNPLDLVSSPSGSSEQLMESLIGVGVAAVLKVEDVCGPIEEDKPLIQISQAEVLLSQSPIVTLQDIDDEYVIDGGVESKFMTSSYCLDNVSDICTIGVCQNASMMCPYSFVIHLLSQTSDILWLVNIIQIPMIWWDKPPLFPPDILRYFIYLRCVPLLEFQLLNFCSFGDLALVVTIENQVFILQRLYYFYTTECFKVDIERTEIKRGMIIQCFVSNCVPLICLAAVGTYDFGLELDPVIIQTKIMRIYLATLLIRRRYFVFDNSWSSKQRWMKSPKYTAQFIVIMAEEPPTVIEYIVNEIFRKSIERGSSKILYSLLYNFHACSSSRRFITDYLIQYDLRFCFYLLNFALTWVLLDSVSSKELLCSLGHIQECVHLRIPCLLFLSSQLVVTFLLNTIQVFVISGNVLSSASADIVSMQWLYLYDYFTVKEIMVLMLPVASRSETSSYCRVASCMCWVFFKPIIISIYFCWDLKLPIQSRWDHGWFWESFLHLSADMKKWVFWLIVTKLTIQDQFELKFVLHWYCIESQWILYALTCYIYVRCELLIQDAVLFCCNQKVSLGSSSFVERHADKISMDFLFYLILFSNGRVLDMYKSIVSLIFDLLDLNIGSLIIISAKGMMKLNMSTLDGVYTMTKIQILKMITMRTCAILWNIATVVQTTWVLGLTLWKLPIYFCCDDDAGITMRSNGTINNTKRVSVYYWSEINGGVQQFSKMAYSSHLLDCMGGRCAGGLMKSQNVGSVLSSGFLFFDFYGVRDMVHWKQLNFYGQIFPINWHQHFSNLALVGLVGRIAWIRMFLLFSLSRPPEIIDLEDKVIFKDGGNDTSINEDVIGLVLIWRTLLQ